MTTQSNQRTLWLFAIVIVVIIGHAVLRKGTPEPAKPSASLVKWVAADDAERLSRESGKPIMYEFTAEWCPPCRQMDKTVFNDATMAERINRDVIPVRLTDRRREEGSNPPHVSRLQSQYNVTGFPTIVFVDATGNQKNRMEGYGGRDWFEEGAVRCVSNT
jgi:thiol:disulfide interchange protein